MAARSREPYVDFHPGPGDATAHFAEEAMRRAAGSPHVADGDCVTTTVSSIESPSVQIAWRLRMAEIGINLPLEPFFEGVQTPDPRVPKTQVDFALWSYEGTRASPTLGPADDRIVRAIASIAATRYHLPMWAEAAGSVARHFGQGWTQQVLAAMLNPPRAPDHIHPLDWVPRMQQAGALVLAWLDEGYATLRTIALGPVDWVVDAAIVAMGEMALRSPAMRGEIESLFSYLRGQVAQEGFTCFAYPLACTWIRLVPADDPRRGELQHWRQQIVSGEVGGTTSSGVIGLIDGINMEDYAEFSVRQELLQAEQPASGLGALALGALSGKATTGLAALADEYGLPLLSPTHTYSRAWAEAINEDPRLQLAFEQTKSRFKLSLQGIDPDSEEARFSHNIMAGKPLDQDQEIKKAQSAAQQLASGGGGDPDPVVFPGQPLAKLSDYVGMMKKMQTGDMNGALAAYGLNMTTYGQVAQAWGTKLGTDPTLNAKMAAMMA